jgi:hypothetical protein
MRTDDDIIRIDNILAVLEKLLDENSSIQTAQNFRHRRWNFNFLRSHPSAKVHGYAVSPYRDDYRASIEGLLSVEQK